MKGSKGVAYIDGASKGNPGPSAYGVVLSWGDNRELYGGYLGEGTNNEAEYKALLHALKAAKEKGIKELIVYTDSELLARQLQGQYRVRAKNLQPLFLQALQTIKNIGNVKIIHIPREKNKKADALVNLVLQDGCERKP